MDFERLYNYRFRHVDQQGRLAVWREVAPHVCRIMGEPTKMLDPAAGRGEFISAATAEETWAVDAVRYEQAVHRPDTNVVVSPIMDATLPQDHFDGVFISNFLEHLYDQNAIHEFLLKMRSVMAGNGTIAIMGPNYRYCSAEYWDYADHFVPLTHRAIEEHLASAGFEIDRTIPQYLPYSFSGRLPTAPWLVRLYLGIPLAWRIFGKQFLVIGRKC
ncbi:MAG TPA: methyltransferase domain-containing protein [Solirubrobacterales bacterium]|nr:methyltransferase domain-containing protein [Solirubrobacterales bacterium]